MAKKQVPVTVDMKYLAILKRSGFILLLVLLSLFIIEASLRLGGSVFLFLQERRNKASLSQRNTYKILCLGESTTALGGDDSYPSQLERILNERSSEREFSVINKGIPAISSYGILLQLADSLDKYNPDIVISMIGINDTWDMVTDKVIYVGNLGKDNLDKESFVKSLRLYKLANWLYYGLVKDSAGMFPRRQYPNFALTRNAAKFDALEENEVFLNDAIRATPNDDNLHIALGIHHQYKGKYEEGEKVLEKAIEMNPANVHAHSELGLCLQRQGKYSRSEEALKKAITIAPDFWPGYVQLGTSYILQKKHAEAEEILKEGIDKFPEIHWLFFELGRYYRWQGDYEEADEFLKEAIELDKNKENIWSYIEMGRNYNNLGRKEESENMFRAALSIDKNSQWVHFELDIPNRNIERLEFDNLALQHNYQEIAGEIIGRKIKLLCVQYPLRRAQSLKDILNPYMDEIVFVDNEATFKKAIMRDGYEKYFSDRFAGDFGHCTREGNRLLAESIANMIMNDALP